MTSRTGKGSSGVRIVGIDGRFARSPTEKQDNGLRYLDWSPTAGRKGEVPTEVCLNLITRTTVKGDAIVSRFGLILGRVTEVQAIYKVAAGGTGCVADHTEKGIALI